MNCLCCETKIRGIKEDGNYQIGREYIIKIVGMTEILIIICI